MRRQQYKHKGETQKQDPQEAKAKIQAQKQDNEGNTTRTLLGSKEPGTMHAISLGSQDTKAGSHKGAVTRILFEQDTPHDNG